MITPESLLPRIDCNENTLVTLAAGRVSNWADGSGNGFDLSQATVGQRPSLVRGSDWGILTDRSDASGSGQWLQNDTVTFDARNASFFVVAKVPYAVQGFLFDVGAAHFGLKFGNTQLSTVWRNGSNTEMVGWTFDVDYALYGIVSNGSNVTVYSPTSTYTAPVATAGTITGFSLGNAYNFANPLRGYKIKRVLAFPTALSASNVAGLYDYVRSAYGCRTSWSRELLLVGDSISTGAYADGLSHWHDPRLMGLTVDTLVKTYATDGRTLAQAVSQNDAALLLSQLLGSTVGRRVAHIFIGTNDLVGGASPTAVEANLSVVGAAIRAGGVKGAIATMLPRNGVSYATWAEYNARIRANWPSYGDALVDYVASEPLLNPGSSSAYSSLIADTTVFKDGVHPTARVHALMARISGEAVKPLLTPLSIPMNL